MRAAIVPCAPSSNATDATVGVPALDGQDCASARTASSPAGAGTRTVVSTRRGDRQRAAADVDARVPRARRGSERDASRARRATARRSASRAHVIGESRGDDVRADDAQ